MERPCDRDRVGNQFTDPVCPRCRRSASGRCPIATLLWAGLMRILITGVTGQVGAALREALGASAMVVGADRSLLDLSYPEKIPSVLNRYSPDVIVNPAAYTAVDRAEDEKE